MHKTATTLLATIATIGILAPAPTAHAATVASCQYQVTADRISVWELPTNSSTRLKYKYRGDVVGGYCDWTYYNETENREYLAVATTAAADDIGWVNRDLVRKL
ncbi:hypothetical protein ABTZ99_44080 [Actinosynnema sp. NPDC002837]